MDGIADEIAGGTAGFWDRVTPFWGGTILVVGAFIFTLPGTIRAIGKWRKGFLREKNRHIERMKELEDRINALTSKSRPTRKKSPKSRRSDKRA